MTPREVLSYTPAYGSSGIGGIGSGTPVRAIPVVVASGSLLSIVSGGDSGGPGDGNTALDSTLTS
jgi:hypothetical protein